MDSLSANSAADLITALVSDGNGLVLKLMSEIGKLQSQVESLRREKAQLEEELNDVFGDISYGEPDAESSMNIDFNFERRFENSEIDILSVD
ncbi:unnamed protein product [Oikopleura dioica]|uniref:Uncharacterized protein n=1 Tax=Oikopleura dioica TaxID=34765 RepID=E4XH24_OIKDI|nr:unnamed protein product [Oikopleura dioica]CBY41162.1 unnamed protein product [Oikopleura dioica]